MDWLEWLRTIVASVIGGALAVGGAFGLELLRWRRQDRVQYRDQLSDLYEQLFGVLNKADTAISTVMTIWSGPDDARLQEMLLDSWQRIYELAPQLDQLTSKVQTIAPAATNRKLGSVAGLAAFMALGAPASGVATPSRPSEDMARTLNNAIDDLMALMRRDLGHVEPSDALRTEESWLRPDGR